MLNAIHNSLTALSTLLLNIIT